MIYHEIEMTTEGAEGDIIHSNFVFFDVQIGWIRKSVDSIYMVIGEA